MHISLHLVNNNYFYSSTHPYLAITFGTYTSHTEFTLCRPLTKYWKFGWFTCEANLKWQRQQSPWIHLDNHREHYCLSTLLLLLFYILTFPLATRAWSSISTSRHSSSALVRTCLMCITSSIVRDKHSSDDCKFLCKKVI